MQQLKESGVRLEQDNIHKVPLSEYDVQGRCSFEERSLRAKHNRQRDTPTSGNVTILM